jgi:hypothetical protein
MPLDPKSIPERIGKIRYIFFIVLILCRNSPIFLKPESSIKSNHWIKS